MGSGQSVAIRIKADRKSVFYYAGELISGTVYIEIKEGYVAVEQASVVLTGETGFTTTHTIIDSEGSTRTETDFNSTCFLSEKQVFATPWRDSKDMIYNPGRYAWRFDIPTPENLPPTINDPSKYPHIRYHLKFGIEKPPFNKPLDGIQYVTIYPRVNPANNSQYMNTSVYSNQNRKDVILKGVTEKPSYLPGETIIGAYELTNPRRMLVKKLYLSLIQHAQIDNNSRKEVIVKITLPSLSYTKHEYVAQKFNLVIPELDLAPSCQYFGGYQQQHANINIGYILELAAKVEGVFTNFVVNIPIIMATPSTKTTPEYQPPSMPNSYQNSLPYYPEANVDPRYSQSQYPGVSQ